MSDMKKTAITEALDILSKSELDLSTMFSKG